MGTLTPARNFAVVAAIMGVLAASTSRAFELEGYTEPYRTIKVASDETGIVEEVLVREGKKVKAGTALARLNSTVHEKLLAIAEHNMRAEGRVNAAKAELRHRQSRLEKLRLLRNEGHARQEEVDRGDSEVAVAEANLRTAREELVTRQLEYERIKTQISRRTVYAPIDGVVTTLHKYQGEFVAPNDPHVLTLVVLDRLLANFTMSGVEAAALRVDQKITVRFPADGLVSTAIVDFIAPVTDAQSGMVVVKLRIDNSEGRFRSGERCQIRLPD